MKTKLKKVMLFGLLDKEDGGYLGTVGFKVPKRIHLLEEGYHWLIEKGYDIAGTLIEEFPEVSVDDVLVDPSDLNEMYWDYGLVLTFVKDGTKYTQKFSSDFVKVYE